MNCPRCRSTAFFEDFGNGEWILSCSICGHHASQQIEAFHNGVPIFANNSHNPLGVVITIKGSHPYYTKEQRDKYIELRNSKGFTYFDGVHWVYEDHKTKKTMPISAQEFLQV